MNHMHLLNSFIKIKNKLVDILNDYVDEERMLEELDKDLHNQYGLVLQNIQEQIKDLDIVISIIRDMDNQEIEKAKKELYIK